MIKFLIICSLVCLEVPSFAQLETNASPSELISSLQKKNPDSIKVQYLLQLSLYYYFQRADSTKALDSVRTLLQQAKELSDEIHSVKWQPEILCFLGKYYYKTGKIGQANDYFIRTANAINHVGPVIRQIERWKELAWNIQELDTIGMTRTDCFEKMISLYAQLNNKEKEIDTQRDIADTHMKQGKLDLAEQELLEVLALSKANGSYHLFYTYNLLAVTHHLKGNYNKALNYALQAIESMQNAGGSWPIILYSHVANLYHELGQTEKSIEYFRIVFKLSPPNPVDFYYIREAGVFVRDLIKQKKEGEAHVFLFDFSKKYPPADPYGKASLARTFAYYYNAVRNYTLADRYTRQMISLEGLLGRNNEIRRDVEYDIGEYYSGKKQFQKAAAHFQIALEEAMLNNSANAIKDINLALYKTDSSLGNYASAIRHLNKYHALNDSIFDVAKLKQIEELEVKYESEKKEQNIRLLEKEGALQRNEILQAGYTRNWILGGMALLLIIMSLLVYNITLKQRTNKKLGLQQKEIEQQNISLRHLVSEKEWLIREIHHRVKNNFQTVMSLLGTQSVYLKNEAALDAIAEGRHRINAMSLIHQKLYQAENMSSINMPGYVNELVDYLRDSFTINNRIRFHLQIERIELDLSHCIPLGLILNEAITNSFKHAFPDDREGLISISLKWSAADHLLLTLEDNGIGLPPGFNNTKQDTLGMNLIRGLSKEIGARLTIRSQNGTQIAVNFVYDPDITHGIKQWGSEATYSV
ncbi:histidine kinase dimerization/phosphoacceptor domain -containing protein [Flavitalea sp. BT771]|uniref:tetratricopeptide repeat-containing sensor histidine kinase n=1 Tax=Flavitalea sp. BT771 TaxID=3063329 RepID=UPI0026E3D902|nr:histidine kinase dimerization/phosphoacceptor domain -containing protein [Flavitalea sp. BT771]MDO6432716.1 histidine kinase dimerization/phosphoacceptor domain -containing protein [Flavitalea sp. BT771]MDV6222008.1 histidine kinase dimerization/phosphoacceptor domain -containing protein [Flavitalea sp. BT771]